MTDLRKTHCNSCAPVAERRPGMLCDDCLDIACDIACDIVEANRRKFQLLLNAGVSRKMANDIMIARINGGPPS